MIYPLIATIRKIAIAVVVDCDGYLFHGHASFGHTRAYKCLRDTHLNGLAVIDRVMPSLPSNQSKTT